VVLFLLLLLASNRSSAQGTPPAFRDELSHKVSIDSTAKIFVSAIRISGNKITRNYIIKREMRMQAGDSILASTLLEKLSLSKELIYNTTLFTEVELQPQFVSATDMTIQVTVKEKWYIYPSPQFQLVDRNFNEWVNNYNADLNRVIYGAKFAHYNLSGRRDQLRIFLLTGYARNFSFTYSAPYSNRKLTEGFFAAAGYTENREINYKTNANNLLLRFSNTEFVRKTIAASGAYILRRGFYRRHVFSIGYTATQVVDSVITKYNPSYFGSTKNKIGFPEAAYSYSYIHTNNIKYPLKGKIYSFSFLKRGPGFTGGINMLSIDADYNRYIPHGRNWYSSVQAHAKIKAPFELAYINQKAFGYGEFYLRGLENYVVDGVAGFLAQYTLKKKLISFNIPVPIKNKIVPKIPFSFYVKTFADAGYSHSKLNNDSRLGNRLLYTGGFGLDVLTLYDINIMLQYSFNQLGEKGLFLHARGGF
jgi:outer membrane protein assembly factor BamA